MFMKYQFKLSSWSTRKFIYGFLSQILLAQHKQNVQDSQDYYVYFRTIILLCYNLCNKMMWAALFLTSNLLDLANKVHKALWGSDLEAVSDSCEKNDWTLKKVEREGRLLRAWVITLHPPPHPQPKCLGFFLVFFPCRLKIYWATFSQLVRFIFTLNLWQVLCKLVRIILWVKTEHNKLKRVFKKLLQ